MKKYLELFRQGFDNTVAEKRKIKNGPYVACSITTREIVFTEVPKPAYVTFKAEEDNSSIGLTKLSTNQILEYSTDKTTWNTFDTTTNIPLNNGSKVYVRGVLMDNNTSSNYTQFKMTGKITASGNCNALWNHQDLDAPLKKYCGRSMFSDCSSLTTAPELPATTLARYCYYSMFYGCTSLTAAPELPATTLVHNCYDGMFMSCKSLTTAPELSATSLEYCCYQSMFQNCTSLTTPPELPATTLEDYCYTNMFRGCTSLTTAPELPATKLAVECYLRMFADCTSLVTTSELPATTLADSCYKYMFENCTSLVIAPELPATKLVSNCYYCIFSGCTSLNYIKCLATDISAYYCTFGIANRVASSGTFIKHPDMTSWSTGNSGIPSGWTVVDAEL
jgi:hypothetical protein